MRYTILHERPNPTTAYFLEPLIRRAAGSAEYISFDEVPAKGRLANATVLIVRYVSPHWHQAVEEAAGQIGRLVYFMDDDLWDTAAWSGLPLRYRWKMFRRALLHRRWVERMGAELWTSSAFLAEKYSAQLIPLGVPDADRFGPEAEVAASTPVFFYHGSASHRLDAEWLYPVVRDVLAVSPDASFEIIASGPLGRRYSALDRTRVVPPMIWSEYVQFCRLRRRAVGLAPALDCAFNRARAPVKYLDVARCGGVGIYSAGSVFDARVEHECDGLLLANDRDRWVEAILGLLGDPLRREKMRRVARARIAALAESAG